MRLARVIAALSFLGLIVSVAMPAMTNGRASGAEALPFVVGFGSLLVIAGLLSFPLSKGVLLSATITLGLAALGSGFVAAVNTETAMREGADVWSSFDHLEMLSKRARDNDGALDSFEAANIREQRQRVETEIEEANAADADRNAAWGAAVPAWIGVVVCLVRWLRARRVAAPPPPVPA